MYEDLRIIHWPDPRLKRRSEPFEQVDGGTRELALRMIELMHAARGVGLAAPQVGVNRRLFVANPTGAAGDDRAFVNPALSDLSAEEEEGEEGCLSLPGVNTRIRRSLRVRLEALDLDGQPVALDGEGYLARIWQHEVDHLNGVLLLDRMGAVGKIAHRRALRDMEEAWQREATARATRPA